MTGKQIILITILLAAFSLSFQGVRGVWDPSEGRYVCVATVMLDQNNWLHPLLHAEQPHWTKPPMTYWAIASSIKLFGYTAFAARFPGALAFMLTILLVYFLGRIFTPRFPWLPAIIYATSLFPFVASNIITTDGILTFFETAGMACFAYLLWMSKKNGFWRYAAYLGWIAFGLGFMTKGPPSLLPLIALIIFLLFFAKGTEAGFKIFFKGIVLFFIFGFTWYLIVVTETPSLLKYFLWNEVLLRVSTTHYQRNSQWYGALAIYIPTLLLGTLPWGVPVFRSMWINLKSTFRMFRNSGPGADPKDIFLLLWFFCPLAVFFVAQSRLALYILPLFVPLSLMAARSLPIEILKRKSIRIGLPLWCALLLSLRIISGFVPTPDDNRMIWDKITTLLPSKAFDEIVFVDSTPYYGLSLYSQLPIEKVNLQEGEVLNENDGNMKEELFEHEGTRLWMVLKSSMESFVELNKKFGNHVDFLGEIKGKKKYGVFIDKKDRGQNR